MRSFLNRDFKPAAAAVVAVLLAIAVFLIVAGIITSIVYFCWNFLVPGHPLDYVHILVGEILLVIVGQLLHPTFATKKN